MLGFSSHAFSQVKTKKIIKGTYTSTTTISGDFNVEAGNDIVLDDVSAASILARAQGGTITGGVLSAPGGSVDLLAQGAIDVLGIDALTILLRSLDGGIRIAGAANAEEEAERPRLGLRLMLQMASIFDAAAASINRGTK